MNELGRRLGALVTRRRVKAYAAIVLVVVVVEYVFSYATGTGFLDRFGQVKGTDFLQFYVAGQLVAAGHGSTLFTFVPPFEFPAQFAAEARLLAPQVGDPRYAFVVPPFYALLFIPLTLLAYLQAYALWIVLNVCLLFGTLRLLRPYVTLLQGADRRLVYLVALAFFPFLECLLDGQNAVVSLFLFAAAYVALRQRRDVLAGVALGLALYKPQLVLVVALLLLIGRNWRALAGLLGTGAALVGVSWAIVGTGGMLDYAALSATMPGWVYLPGWRTWNMHSWYSFFVLLGADPAASRVLTGVFSAITLALAISAWRRLRVEDVGRFNLQFALAILGTILVSPHVFAYDLTLLILPGLLLADASISPGSAGLWPARPRRLADATPALPGHRRFRGLPPGTEGRDGWLRALLAICFFIPLVSRFSAMELGLQLSVLVVAAVFAVTYRAVTQSPEVALATRGFTLIQEGR